MEFRDCDIQIITNNEINPVFIRANSALLVKHSIDNETLLEQLWVLEYHSKLIKNAKNSHWSTILFNTNQEKMIFLLRWG